MKRVLLLGGSGFLGCNLAKMLNNSDEFDVSVYDLQQPNEHINGVDFFTGSIEDTKRICSVIEKKHINVLVHLVSTIIPGSSLEQYINNCKLVQISTIPLMDYCATHRIELIYLSSGGTVYGVKGGVISENEPVAPISYYGLSKVQIEDLINFYHRRYDLNYLILRPSNPYGFGQNLFGKQGLIAVIIGKILSNEPITVFGDGSIIRDYIYIDDFSFYVKELISKNILNETINIGSGIGYSINQILEVIQRVVNHDIEINYVSARKDDVPKIVLDTTRLHNFVQHKDMTIEKGIQRFYENACIRKDGKE